MRGPIFFDKTVQAFFDKSGYAKIPLLSSEKADELYYGYLQFSAKHHNIDIPFVSTSHSNDAELIGAVDKLILSVVSSEIAKHLLDYEILFSNFLLKKSADNSESAPHQDVTLVDEDKFMSFSIWIALQDTDERNGCMRILSGSHKMKPVIRPNPSYPWRYRNVMENMMRDMVSCPVKKGEALIFSHSTIHASFPNVSGCDRLAAVIALYPKEAETYHYQLPDFNSNMVQKYMMTKDAFIEYVKGAPPAKGKLIAELTYDSSAISPLRYFFESRMANLFG